MKHIQRLILILIGATPLAAVGASDQSAVIRAIQQGNLAVRTAPNCSRTVVRRAPTVDYGKQLSIGRSVRLPIGTTARIVNGCDKNAKVQFGAGNRNTRTFRCNSEKMSPGLANKMNKYMLKCAQEAAARAGVPRPESLFIHHMGCHNHRRMNLPGGRRGGWSQHAYASALDISAIHLIDASGRKTKMSMHQNDYKGKNAVFYDGFRACWARSQRCRPESVGHVKSMRRTGIYGNSLHADHLHLEHKCR